MLCIVGSSVGHPFERIGPCPEVMGLFVLGKLILQMRMRSHPVGLHV